MSAVFFSLASGDFSQDWSNTGLITANNNWDNVPSLVGYLGDNAATTTASIDPRTVTSAASLGAVNVIANLTNVANNTGGVGEFELSDPTVALQGSGTADAPSVVLYLDATGRNQLHLDLDVRHIDADTTNQQFNIQYRIGDSGAWTNVNGGYVANASAANTHLSIDLDNALNGQGQVELRFMTTNAASNDEWLGVDNIHVTSLSQAGATVSVGNVSMAEGDSGDTLMTFTVTRSDASGAFTVDYGTQNGTASAGSDYAATSGTLTFAAGGPLTQTVTVAIHGDTTVEPNEAFTLGLTNLQNTSGAATVLNGTATGTITNDDVSIIKTYEIQGAGHTSAFVGQNVTTQGVVTVIDTTGSKGFWIQDETGDGDARTSDAVFVFTNSAVNVHVGDKVQVNGTVNEFIGSDSNNLTITEVGSSNASIQVIGTGTIAPTIIGAGGLHVPTEVIEDDGYATFDPASDAIDFFESLEGMMVTVKNAQVTDATFVNGSGLGSTWVVADNGAGATGMNDRGGITIANGDMNPEKIQLFADSGVSGLNPTFVAGDHPGDVTGVISYFGGQYELLPTAIASTASAGTAPSETTTLAGDATHVTVGAFNVENLDPTDPQAKFDALGQEIAHNLGSPDILGIEEIQDADGAGAGTNYSGAATLTKLIDAIAAAGGPHYQYVEIAPTANNQTGGEPNGNIRQAFLYNADRVQFVDGSLRQLTDTNLADGDAYNNSRKPLVADFMFNGEKITAIDVHNYSRGGSEELFGQDQPAINSGDQRRIDQTMPIKQYVEQIVTADPHANVAVMGDFNGFQFETSLTQLTSGGGLVQLSDLLAPTDRYSFAFEGNMEEIDHLLVSPTLTDAAQFDIVHVNTGQSDTVRPTDHDPIVSRLLINTGPHAVNDNGAVSEDQRVTLDVLANDNDINTADTKTLVSVSATAQGGHASIVAGQVVYLADADSFDLLTTGQQATDSFSYVMRDAAGETSTATVTVTVNGVADGVSQTYGAGNDSVTGTTLDEKIDGGAGNDTVDAGVGADTVVGGLGNDNLSGGAGLDSVSAGDGNDTIAGGSGNDVLGGGRGLDNFVFGPAFGHDTVIDFAAGQDHVVFQGVGFTTFTDVMAHALQAGANLIITDAAGDTLQLNNVQSSSLHSADFIFA